MSRSSDDQTVEVFLAQLDEFPQLATEGTPTLCG